MVKNARKAPASPLVLRLRVAKKKSSEEKMARIIQLEYHQPGILVSAVSALKYCILVGIGVTLVHRRVNQSSVIPLARWLATYQVQPAETSCMFVDDKKAGCGPILYTSVQLFVLQIKACITGKNQLANKDKQLKIQNRQLAAKDAANKDLLRSNQKLEIELQKRNSGFDNLLQLYWDQVTQQQQSKKNNEKLHEILTSQSA